MALINTTEPETVAAQLGEALQRRVPGVENVEVHDVEVPQSGGLSNETVLFRASWTLDGKPVDRRLVARIAPTGPTLFLKHDLERDARVIDALHTHTAVPVPDVLFYEPDPSLLGAEFVVLGHREGKAAPHDPPFTVEGWVMDLTPEQRATMADNGLRALAAIHQVDWKAVGPADLDHSTPTRSLLDVTLDELRSFSEWVEAEDRENATVAAGRMAGGEPAHGGGAGRTQLGRRPIREPPHQSRPLRQRRTRLGDGQRGVPRVGPRVVDLHVSQPHRGSTSSGAGRLSESGRHHQALRVANAP